MIYKVCVYFFNKIYIKMILETFFNENIFSPKFYLKLLILVLKYSFFYFKKHVIKLNFILLKIVLYILIIKKTVHLKDAPF